MKDLADYTRPPHAGESTGDGYSWRGRLSRPTKHAKQLSSSRSRNWFGAAGMRAGSRGYRRADVVMTHYLGPGRHIFLDCSVTDPATGAALSTAHVRSEERRFCAALAAPHGCRCRARPMSSNVLFCVEACGFDGCLAVFHVLRTYSCSYSSLHRPITQKLCCGSPLSVHEAAQTRCRSCAATKCTRTLEGVSRCDKMTVYTSTPQYRLQP